MFTSFSRSYQLVRHTWSILRENKEVLIFPVLSGLASLLVAASFIIPLIVLGVGSGTPAEGGAQTVKMDLVWGAYLFLFYLVSYFITIFFNVGVMHYAAIRMEGGDPKVRDGFEGALKHMGKILLWSLVSATVGMILRAIEERAAVFGKIIAAMIGVAWSLLTYFALPVMIFEGQGVGRAIKRSGELFRKRWGEAVIGEAGMGLFLGMLFLLGLIPVGLAVFIATQGSAGAFFAALLWAVALIYWIAVGVVSAALKGIFHVALYRYASTGHVPDEYPKELIVSHWKRKR